MVGLYYRLGAPEKGAQLAGRLAEELDKAASFYRGFGSYADDEYRNCLSFIKYLTETLEENGDTVLSQKVSEALAHV